MKKLLILGLVACSGGNNKKERRPSDTNSRRRNAWEELQGPRPHKANRAVSENALRRSKVHVRRASRLAVGS